MASGYDINPVIPFMVRYEPHPDVEDLFPTAHISDEAYID